MATTTTTEREVEFELTLQNVNEPTDIRTRTIAFGDPVTTAGGLSAIIDFKNLLLTNETIEAAGPGLMPNTFFQPTDEQAGTYFTTTGVDARIVETTKTVTTVE